MQTKKVKLAAGRVRYYFNPLFNSLFSLIIINMVTRCCGNIYLGIIVLYAYVKFFMCIKNNRDVCRVYMVQTQEALL